MVEIFDWHKRADGADGSLFQQAFIFMTSSELFKFLDYFALVYLGVDQKSFPIQKELKDLFALILY